MAKTYDIGKLLTEYMDARAERSEWEAEAKTISDYIVPGRGIYQLFSKPRKRKLTSSMVINPRANSALQVLTSGMQAGLTSPSRPWFSLRFTDPRLNKNLVVKQWLYECEKAIYMSLAQSNFYQIVHSFYTEYAAFGTASMYVGEDSVTPFRFELLTFGEFAFFVDATHRPSKYFRTIFMTPAQLIEKFGIDNVSQAVKDLYTEKSPKLNTTYITVIKAVCPDKYNSKMNFTAVYFEIAKSQQDQSKIDKPLQIKGYYEFPYPLARWETIGSDIYGIGPGAAALPDVKRLQEMEKSFLMATHKEVDPPLQAPARMRNKIKSLPGGISYNTGPNEKVEKLYEGKFDYVGVSHAIERVEQRIDKCFYNDVFITSARDPNASPLKAREVDVREDEKIIRLGPVVERLYYEFFQPVIERCFNILDRKELLPAKPPILQQMNGDYDIVLTSPLAQAQKMMSASGIQNFLTFVGQAMQYAPDVVDMVDVDKSVEEFHDISGAPASMLRTPEDTLKIREAKQKAMQEQKAKEEAAAMSQVGGQEVVARSQATKNYADASATSAEAFLGGM